MNRSNAFTLAELLIALTILGVIATFTIPKILQNQQNQTRISIFRETIGNISDVFYQAKLKGDITNADSVTQYMMDHLNYLKACPTGEITEGCRTTNTTCGSNMPGIVLHNGATVSFWTTSNGRDMCIDWNGDLPPNTTGVDQIQVFANAGNTVAAYGAVPGQVVVRNNVPALVSLWNEIFTN